MDATMLDTEMHTYFVQLSEEEKKSVVEMIKAVLRNKHTDERISIEQYNREIDESEAEIERGESFTHEEVIEMSKKWVNA